MEVHQHSHHSAQVHKKKWTHYIWEFLMLFLAVFCGFLAENQREHFIEHQREKQFIRSLIRDLEADTATLNELINNRTIREGRLDTLTYLLNNDSAAFFTKDIYFLANTIPRVTVFQFTPNDGTIQQLKNAGAFRLIRNRAVTDSIIKYDANVRGLGRFDEQEQAIINIHREVAPRVFFGIELGRFADADNLPLRLDHSPPLVTGFESSLNEFNYRLLSVKNVNRGYRRESRKLLRQATNLILTLKKEYHQK
jgi:hypothetical protein